MAQQKMLIGHVKGDAGGYYEPSVDDEGMLSLTAKNGAPEIQTKWNIKGPAGANGLPGPAGPAGPAGENYKPGGTDSQIVLGDGSTIDISVFITNNIETIRDALGLATAEHMGLVPKLPSSAMESLG